MRQLVQSVRSGELRIVDAPDPLVGPTEVLVATTHSLVSAGTERAVRKLASASLLQKAKARPDLVKQVLRKARTEGVRSTFTAVQTRLDEDMPLGYSGAGIVLAVGEHVSGVRPGMRVATGGAGHGDIQIVAGNLAVPIPAEVTFSEAAFATVASIALHGLRLANVGPGGKIGVIGLGLIGQLTVRLAIASGLNVVGIDLREWAVAKAVESGAMGLQEEGDATTQQIIEWSRNRGVDAVLLTAATPSSDPTKRAASIARDRATIVIVGDVGMELERTPLYEKELTIKVARSYGPGRYERSYEDWAIDYPIGHIRWTEGRNIEAVLDLMATRRLAVDDLVTHHYGFEDVSNAYGLLSKPGAEYLGIRLDYPAERASRRPSATVAPDINARRIGIIGAGNFARMVLAPAIVESGLGTIVSVASAGGASAEKLAGQLGARAVTPDELINDSRVDVVVVATSHSTHAELVVRALEAGKHVFCEKPLGTSEMELDGIEAAWLASGKSLAVGFNRRHSDYIRHVQDLYRHRVGPLVITYRVNAGQLEPSHWYYDRREGGRAIGEACHFVDTCNAVVGAPVQSVKMVGGSDREQLLSDNFAIAIEYADRSCAVVTYASRGGTAVPKEIIDIQGGGTSVEIRDFAELTIDAKVVKDVARGKGHVEQLRHFARALETGDSTYTDAYIETMRATLGAAASNGKHS